MLSWATNKLEKRALIRSACNSTKSSRVLCEEAGLAITSRRVRQILNQFGRVQTAKMLRKPRLSPKNIWPISVCYFSYQLGQWVEDSDFLILKEVQIRWTGWMGLLLTWYENRTENFLKTSVNWWISDGLGSHRLHKNGPVTIHQ